MAASINKIFSFFKESRVELKKVVWPTRQEIIRHTAVVIFFSLGVSVFLGFVDYIFLFIIKQIF